MQGKKDSNAEQKKSLQNFERQLTLFPVRKDGYWRVLLDYFRICPYVQSLEINWKKISQEYPNQPPHKAVPRWVCSNHKNCAYNERCHPPFRWSDIGHEYESVDDRDIRFISKSKPKADGENTTVQELTMGQVIAGCNNKVLASPERLRLTREKRHYSQEQVANMCGLSRQDITGLETIQEDPKHNLNRIAAKNRLVPIKYSLCCLLAVLYEVKPGYLMGQIDDSTRDVYVNKRTYYKKSDIYYQEFDGVEMKQKRRSDYELKEKIHVHEEYEVAPFLDTPILYFSDAKRKGRLAADKIRSYEKPLDPNYRTLLELCEKIYYWPIPYELRREFHSLLEGLLIDINTAEGEPGIRDIIQIEKNLPPTKND